MSESEKEYIQLSSFLKEGTRLTHNDAETNDFQHRLASADLSLPAYRAYLGQLYLMHSLLERGLSQAPRLSPAAKPVQYQTEFLERDLAELKVSPEEIKPLPSTTKIMTSIEARNNSDRLPLLGHHYVVLGSKHGAKFIAAQVRKKFGFESAGCLYFDPYGTNFQSIWAEFRAGMDRVTTCQLEADSILQAAKEMFSYFATLGNELSEKIDNVPA